MMLVGISVCRGSSGMPKRLSLIILVTIILASQISCAKFRYPTSTTQSPTVVPPSKTTAIYTNSDNGFTIEYPKTWIDKSKETTKPSVLALFMDPKSCDSIGANFVIMKETLDTALSAKAYFDLTQSALRTNMSQYTPLSTDEVTINGSKAIKHDYTWVNDNKTVHQRIIFLVKNKTGYLIIFSCAQSCYDNSASDFGKISNSFKFTN